VTRSETFAGGLTVAVDIGGTFTDVALVENATGRAWRAKTPSRPDDPSVAFLDGIRLALAGGRVPVPVHDRATLGAGASFDGPAIVTQLDTTTLVAPGWRATVHASGALLLERV
jgi:N-methylhydantoinase A